jgi:hypothetical protein
MKSGVPWKNADDARVFLQLATKGFPVVEIGEPGMRDVDVSVERDRPVLFFEDVQNVRVETQPSFFLRDRLRDGIHPRTVELGVVDDLHSGTPW